VATVALSGRGGAAWAGAVDSNTAHAESID
jgi:hypothetical protein